jgi:hypothetical protein
LGSTQLYGFDEACFRLQQAQSSLFQLLGVGSRRGGDF